MNAATLCAMRRRAAREAKPAPLAGKRHQLLMCAISTTHKQKFARQNAAFKSGLELVFGKPRQTRAGPGSGLSEEFF